MAKRQPKPKAQPPQVERPQFTGIDLEEDEDDLGSTIPDDDGWVRLEAEEPKPKGGRRGKGKADKPAR